MFLYCKTFSVFEYFSTSRWIIEHAFISPNCMTKECIFVKTQRWVVRWGDNVSWDNIIMEFYFQKHASECQRTCLEDLHIFHLTIAKNYFKVTSAQRMIFFVMMSIVITCSLDFFLCYLETFKWFPFF